MDFDGFGGEKFSIKLTKFHQNSSNFFSAINVWWPLMDFDGFGGEKFSIKLT